MNGKHFAQRLGTKRNFLAALAASAIFTSGCSNMMSTAPTLTAQSSGGQLSGTVHGGSQPVAFSTVTLYYAGESGIGSGDPSGIASGPPIVAAVTTSADDGNGSFSFQKSATNGQTTSGNTFSCPASGDPLVYVVARGGNTLNSHDSSVNNSAAAFLAVFGLCSQINASSRVSMTEVTTVASMVAMQQYFNPVTESFGADGILVGKTAMTNTLATISNLANVATGTAVTSKVVSGSGVSVTVTPQTSKVNALANIIASCVNNATSSATPCTTLFSNATPPDTAVTSRPYRTPAFSQATDVLQALYYMLTNPTNGSQANLQNLYNLIPAVGSAFQPTLAAAPTDWTVAISYSSTGTCGTGGGNFINQPEELNIDLSGNVWIANGQSTTGNLSAISSSGVPVACTSGGGGARGGAVVDTAGNVWYASQSTNTLLRYNPNSNSTLQFSTAAAPLAVFADGGNGSGDTVSNIYFTTSSGTSLYMIPHGASASVATTPVQISTVVGPNPIRIMAGKDLSIWVTSGSNFVSRVVAAASGAPNYLNGYSTTQFPIDTNAYGLALNNTGTFVSSNSANNEISLLTGSGTNYSMQTGWPTAAGLAGISQPTGMAVDGRSNIWTVNTAPNSGSGLASLSEVSVAGVALFPSGTVSGGLQLDPSYLSVGRSIVIDQSGNVWIANEGPSGTPANFITEIVGAAVPVYQPFAWGLANGRFQNMP
ncbi:MAG: hypothetical protein JST61_04310 [Acidobacteria bacterium]|nr:hypothetical protein [Acidobacteriota bacterium]